MKNIKNKGLRMIGVALLIGISMMQLYGVSTSVASHIKTEPIGVRTPVPTDDVVCLIDSNSKEDVTPKQIIIEKVGINLPIERITVKDGTWAVGYNVANYAAETGSLSSTEGNIGLFAHDLPTGFANIKNLQNGDIIIIKGLDITATYSVYSKFSTIPSNVDVFSQTKSPIVTLITCDGLFFENRYVVQARLNKLTKTNCHENII